MRFHNRLLANSFCRLALGDQTVKNTCVYLRPNLSSTKVDASGWPNETQDDLRRLASPLGQRLYCQNKQTKVEDEERKDNGLVKLRVN